MYRSAKIIMLSSDKKSHIISHNYKIDYSEKCKKDYNNSYYENLYVTLDDEIMKDDWYIKNNMSINQSACGEVQKRDYKNCEKIIGTTDQSLTETYSPKKSIVQFPNKNRISQLSYKFILEYINKYNKGNIITNVLVEYEKIYHSKRKGITEFQDERGFYTWRVKKNSDNTINVKLIKDSYNKEEVIDLFNKCADDLNNTNTIQNLSYAISKWVKINL